MPVLRRSLRSNVIQHAAMRHELVDSGASSAPNRVSLKEAKALSRKKGNIESTIPQSNKRRRVETTTPKKGISKRERQKQNLVVQPATPSLQRAATSLIDRPAEPHATNAPLVKPHGSRLLAYNAEDPDLSTSKTGLPRPTTDTRHVLEEACAHLIKMDPRMKPLIDKHYCTVFCPEELAETCDPFRNLCSGIIAQQVSGAAAASIKKKFIGLFANDSKSGADLGEEGFPTPDRVAACSVPFLRQAGLSERKAEYIQGLAQKFASGELSAEMLIKASDEEVLEKLTAVRGLGRWSVEMFACFGLKRMDVLSTGDLGVQ